MNAVQSIGGFLTPYDYENITVATVAIGFTATKVKPGTTVADRDLGHARSILVTVEEADIRYTIHGSDPVAGSSTGHLAVSGSVLSFSNYQAMLNFRAVRAAGTSAKLKVTYLR